MSGDSAKEEAIFDAAIQLDDPAARVAFLDDACRGNTTLRDAVEELLAFHDTKDDLLSKPAMELTRPAATVGGELLGSVLDRYRLVDRIGEGAFGVTADLAAALLHIARGELDAAEPLIQSASEGSRKAGARRAVGRAECFRADLLSRRRRFDAAERLLLTLDRAARDIRPFEIDDVLLVTRRLVKLYEAWEKPAEAARWRNRSPGR